MEWILLFGLPLIIGPGWQTEIPKVIVFEVFVVLIVCSRLLKNRLKFGIFWPQLMVGGLSLVSGLSLSQILGNPFRLQGVFLLWMLLLWSVVCDKKLPGRWIPLASLFLILAGTIWFGNNEAGRAIGTLGEPNALAAASVFIWPFVGPWAVFLSAGIIWLAQSASGGVALLVQLVVLAFSNSKYKRHAIGVGVGLWMVTLVLPFFEQSRLWENRTDVWRTALVAGATRPILGWGFGNITEALRQTAVKTGNIVQYQFVDSSHNLFLDWWVQGGIIGLGLLVFLVITALNKLRNEKLLVLFGLLVAMSFNPASIVTLVHFWWLIGTL